MTPSAASPSTAGLPCAGDDLRWQAVAHRDAAADGQFVFAVCTTGVYCRPSCSSRRPLRANVSFFASPTAAEQAGFRACKRCSAGGDATLADIHAAAVARVCRAIADAEAPPSLEDLARVAAMSPFHLHRVFKRLTGVTPKAYAAACRADRLRSELSTASNVTEAIYAAGFRSSGRCYAGAREILGMAPTRYRRGGSGVSIRFAVGQCSLGAVLVAATGQGVCAITLGDEPEELVHDLQRRFPRAELLAGDRSFEQTVAQVVALVEAPGSSFQLPLDIRGTAFQQRVWQALRSIPPGETWNYAQVARHIGLPKAVRAVAGACGANHLAVAIPCHRVVRTDGTLSGYRWGVERKRVLLAREQAG